eukprot:1479971-Amphidinium_carterae.1
MKQIGRLMPKKARRDSNSTILYTVCYGGASAQRVAASPNRVMAAKFAKVFASTLARSRCTSYLVATSFARCYSKDACGATRLHHGQV